MEEKKEIKKEVEPIKEKKSKKKIFIIGGVILLVGILVLVYFIFIKSSSSNAKIIYYRYKDELFPKKHYVLNGTDTSKLESYTYKCKYSKCVSISSERNIGVGYKNDWVIIADSDQIDPMNNSKYTAIVSNADNYIIYNVVTKKEYKVPINRSLYVHDLVLDKDGTPKSLLVTLNDDDNRDIDAVIDVKTGSVIFTSKDIVYGSKSNYDRTLKVVNNGKDDYYLFNVKNYSPGLLYDQNFNYITGLYSTDYFDDEGNIMQIISEEKTSKDYFIVYGVDGKELRTSKKYDDVEFHNGYVMIQNNNEVYIANSREKKLVDISNSGKKNTYTTSYNRYYFNNPNEVVVYEIQNPNSETNKIFVKYVYDIKQNKLNKEKMDLDGRDDPYAALTRFLPVGYETYKLKNTTFYFDKDINDEKKNELKEQMKKLSEDKLSKKLFDSKQSVYIFAKYNYEVFNKSDYICYDSSVMQNSNYYAEITIDDYSLISQMSVNYFSNNRKKLDNDAFRKLYDKYYSYINNGYHFVGKKCYPSGDDAFFSFIISSYYISNYSSSYQSDDNANAYRRIEEDNKKDDFDNLVKKYVESYVIK